MTTLPLAPNSLENSSLHHWSRMWLQFPSAPPLWCVGRRNPHDWATHSCLIPPCHECDMWWKQNSGEKEATVNWKAQHPPEEKNGSIGPWGEAELLWNWQQSQGWWPAVLQSALDSLWTWCERMTGTLASSPGQEACGNVCFGLLWAGNSARAGRHSCGSPWVATEPQMYLRLIHRHPKTRACKQSCFFFFFPLCVELVSGAGQEGRVVVARTQPWCLLCGGCQGSQQQKPAGSSWSFLHSLYCLQKENVTCRCPKRTGFSAAVATLGEWTTAHDQATYTFSPTQAIKKILIIRWCWFEWYRFAIKWGGKWGQGYVSPLGKMVFPYPTGTSVNYWVAHILCCETSPRTRAVWKSCETQLRLRNCNCKTMLSNMSAPFDLPPCSLGSIICVSYGYAQDHALSPLHSLTLSTLLISPCLELQGGMSQTPWRSPEGSRPPPFEE